MLDAAETVLAAAAATQLSSFLGAFTILLREGLEALLVVIAMLAFLRRAERPEMMRWVHGGQVAALLAGLATWLVATKLITVSGGLFPTVEAVGAQLRTLALVVPGFGTDRRTGRREATAAA